MQTSSAAPAPAEPLLFAVVTGASEGIGCAIARRLAAAGRPLLLVARDADKLTRLVADLAGSTGAPVAFLALDVTDPDAPARIETQVAALGGTVDFLVNAAGSGLSGPFDSHAPHEIDRLVALNIAALTRLMRHFLPAMRQRRRGGILNLASLGGYIPGPYQAAYYASKAYVISLSEAVAAEVAADRVRVTVVSPGPVDTGFHARMRSEQSYYRRLIPAASPAGVARWALLAHGLGARAITPGFVNNLLLVSLRILPHRLVIPLVGWLLKPRGSEAGNVRRER